MSVEEELDQRARSSAQAYMGGFAWPTIVLGLFAVISYVATPFLVVSGQLPFLVGGVLMALLTYMSYTVLHDAAHGSINGSHKSLRWVNEAMGYLAAWVLGIPLTAHRHEHLAHHRNTNHSHDDPDYVVANMARSPLHAVWAALRVVYSQYSFYMRHRWTVSAKGQNLRFCLEIVMALGLRVVLVVFGLGWEGVALFAVAGIGGVMVLMYLFAYIVHVPHNKMWRYLDTSTIIAPAFCNTLVTYLWGFQNYHSIHHLFPRVPFYQYRKLFDDIGEIMIARGAPVYSVTVSGLKKIHN